MDIGTQESVIQYQESFNYQRLNNFRAHYVVTDEYPVSPHGLNDNALGKKPGKR